MALILDGTNGLSDVDGTAGTPAIRGSDANTGVFFGTDIVGVSTGGSERMRVDASGNVGIGTSSPTGRFELQSDANSAQEAYVRNINAGSSAYSVFNVGNDSSNTAFRLLVGSSTASAFGGADAANLVNSRNSPMTFWTNNTERARIDSSGNLLVGKTTTSLTTQGIQIAPNAEMFIARVATDQALRFYNASTGAQVGSVVVGASSTAYNTSSDYRLKHDIQPMMGALAKVAALKPVTYKWNSDGVDGEGFIAHELAEVVPQAVYGEKDAVETYTDEDGNEQTRPKYQGIDTSFLVATLTAAIQEQQAIIQSLTARIEALENQT